MIEIQPLLLRVAEGDAHGLAELYDATARQVFGILRRILWSAESAEEVAWEVYVRVWRTAGRFDPERGAAWPWLALLTRGLAIDRMRADGSYRDALEEPPRRGPRAAPSVEPGGGASREVERPERAELVRTALQALPGEQRRALELAFFGGLTHDEIAERTDAAAGTVKTRIRTALVTLRERLGPALEG